MVNSHSKPSYFPLQASCRRRLGEPLRHLLLATLEDPSDPKSWSGTPYHLCQALARKVDRLSIVSKLPVHKRPDHALIRLAAGGKPPRYPLWMTGPALERFGATVDSAVEELRPDAVLSISSPPIIASGLAVPTYMLSDAPWLAYKEAYRDYDPLPWLGRAFAKREAEAARRCAGLFFASEWAVNDAAKRYGADTSRIHNVPFGANISPGDDFDLEGAISRRLANRKLTLLYIGKDWDRKGGPLAVEVASTLAAQGVDVVLNIVGCEPGGTADLPFVRVHGRLRMDQPAEASALRGLLLESHFLLVPTRAECFGLVFAEAQAFALPPVTRAVHALPSVVEDGTSGILLGVDADAAAYAERISEVWRSPGRYRSMAEHARKRFETCLNWDAAADRILQTIF